MNKSREKFIKGATGERGEQEFLNDQQVLSWLRFGKTQIFLEKSVCYSHFTFWVRISGNNNESNCKDLQTAIAFEPCLKNIQAKLKHLTLAY
jgi:hypothetical protein